MLFIVGASSSKPPCDSDVLAERPVSPGVGDQTTLEGVADAPARPNRRLRSASPRRLSSSPRMGVARRSSSALKIR